MHNFWGWLYPVQYLILNFPSALQCKISWFLLCLLQFLHHHHHLPLLIHLHFPAIISDNLMRANISQQITTIVLGKNYHVKYTSSSYHVIKSYLYKVRQKKSLGLRNIPLGFFLSFCPLDFLVFSLHSRVWFFVVVKMRQINLSFRTRYANIGIFFSLRAIKWIFYSFSSINSTSLTNSSIVHWIFTNLFTCRTIYQGLNF